MHTPQEFSVLLVISDENRADAEKISSIVGPILSLSDADEESIEKALARGISVLIFERSFSFCETIARKARESYGVLSISLIGEETSSSRLRSLFEADIDFVAQRTSLMDGFFDVFERGLLCASEKQTFCRHRMAFLSAVEGLLLLNAEGIVIDANPSFLLMCDAQHRLPFGVIGRPPEVLGILSDEPVSWHEAGRYEVFFEKNDKSRTHALLNIGPYDSITASRVASLTEISDMKEREAKIRLMATTDPLTGLPNRGLALDRIEQVLIRAAREGTQAAVLFIDLDRFKNVNDSLGHQAGDELLIKVSERLKRVLRASDTVSRFAGDEFLALLPSVSGREGAEMAARKILSSLEKPFILGDKEAHISCSIGISIFPSDGKNVEELLRLSDEAMYVAKRAGRGTVRHAGKELFSTHILIRALAEGTLGVFYELRTGTNGDIIDIFLRLPGEIEKEESLLLVEKAFLSDDISVLLLSEAAKASRSISSSLLPFTVRVSLPYGFASSSGAVDGALKILFSNDAAPDKIEISLSTREFMESQQQVSVFIDKITSVGCSVSFWGYGESDPLAAEIRSVGARKTYVSSAFVRNILSNPESAKPLIEVLRSVGIELIVENISEENSLALQSLGLQNDGLPSQRIRSGSLNDVLSNLSSAP